MGAPGGDSTEEEAPSEKVPKKGRAKKKRASLTRGLTGGATGSDAWNPAPLISDQPGPAAAGRGSLQAPLFQQVADPSLALALQEIRAQLERILLRQEQMLAGSLAAGSAVAAPSVGSSPRPYPESKAVGPEMQVQLERLAAAQADMQTTLSKFVTGAAPPASRHCRFGDLDDQPKVSIISNHNEEFEKRLVARTTATSEDAEQIQEVARASALKRAEIERMAEQAEVDELKHVFIVAEQDAKNKMEQASIKVVHRLKKMSKTEMAHTVDLFIGSVICLNMIVIGVAMDSDTTAFTLSVDTALSMCFLWEMLIKIKLSGFAGHFCPDSLTEKLMTWNDTVIVVVDLTQLIIEYATFGDEETEGSSMRTSLLRVFRLARLTRIIRLLRLEAFHDLITMVTGLAVGMPVLAWSVVLLFITLYIVALFGRLALGEGGPIEVRQEFDTVVGSLFAVFRCSFGDCTTRSGTTLLGLVIVHYGVTVGCISCLVIFFVTIGIFNVISAIFVEGTLSARMAAAEEKKKERLNDDTRFSSNMKKLIKRVCELADVDMPCFGLDQIEEWSRLEITTADFKDACIHDEEVRDALRELEINEGDLPVLADILDPQNDLVLTLVEILHGIKRLRGDPRRSDIVNVDLMLRDVQESVGKMMDRLGNILMKLG